MAELRLVGDNDDVIELGRKLFRREAPPPPPDGVYPPGIDGFGGGPDFPGMPRPYAGSETVVPMGIPRVDAPPDGYGIFRGAFEPMVPGIGAPGGPPFRPMSRQSGPAGKRPLSVDEARELFDGLHERLQSVGRRVGVVENTLGLRSVPDQNDEGPEDDFGGPYGREADMPTPPPVPPPTAEESERFLRAATDAVGGRIVRHEISPRMSKEEVEAALRRKRVMALAAEGDLAGARTVSDGEEEGMALLRALQDAKDLLGPSAIAVRAGDVFTVQDSPEPAKVIGMGPSWDAALMDAGDKLAKATFPKESPILPDQDLPYEKALAFAREVIGSDVILTFSPADSSRSRVCLSMPVGTPGRKMILAGSFLEALSEYLGHTVDWVRGETQHFTLEERTRRLAEQQRKDCETPVVCCTPPAPVITPELIADVERAERELRERQANNGPTDEEKRDLDAAV